MNNRSLFFFDWDGTLCSGRFWQSLRSENSKVSQTIEDFFVTGENGLLKDWMLGRIISEDVNRFISDKANFSFDSLWSTFVKDCQEMSFDPVLGQRIKKIKEKAKTVLVTGNMDCFRRFIIPALNLDEYFDKIIISSEVGSFKEENDGEQFRKIVADFNTTISDSVLIDDSEKCCAVFEKIGGEAFRTVGPNDTLKLLENFYEKNCF